MSFSVLTFRLSVYDLSWSKNISNSNYNPIFISFLRWWNMLGKIINVMPGVKLNWSPCQKEAIQAVCLVSRMCFGSFLTVTSLQLAELVDGGESLCPPPACVARRLAHLMSCLQRLCVVCPSDIALTATTCIPWKNTDAWGTLPKILI